MKTFDLDGKKCSLIQGRPGAPVFLLALGREEEDTAADVYREVLALRPDADFSLFAFECVDWDDDYSPWPADAFRHFGGGGAAVLDWLKNSALPYCRSLDGADDRRPVCRTLQDAQIGGFACRSADQTAGLPDPLTELTFEGITDPGFTDVSEPVQTDAAPQITDDFESLFFEAQDGYPGGPMDPDLPFDKLAELTFLPELLRTADAADLRTRTPSAPTPRCYVLGYSLAGLFCLWALSKDCGADGAACVSGSLWFPGWDAYSRSASYPADSRIYLSLGGKESNSPDPLVATIGKAYDAQYAALRKAGLRCTYEKNSGGHFASPHKRLAKAIAWLLG